MSAITLELQEQIKKTVVKIIKHYRGKGPEYVKVNVNSEGAIIIDIKGILSNLSEILVSEGAIDMVTGYWTVLKPHLEKNYLQEVKDILKKDFTYSWKICNIENNNRTVVITINLIN